MSSVPTGRIGLNAEISGFVVAEDQSFEARMLRHIEHLRDTARRRLAGLTASRSAPSSDASVPDLPCDSPEVFAAPAPSACAEPAPETQITPSRTAAERLASVRSGARRHLAALIIRSTQISTMFAERLRFADRLRDAGALLWYFTGWLGRQAWRAPRGLKLAALCAGGLYLAPWSDLDAARESAAPLAAYVATPAPAREPSDGWRPIASPIPAYYLEAPELDRMAPKYRARRQSNGARQDIMAFGDLNATGPAAGKPRPAGAVSVEVYPAGQPDEETLFVDVVRRASLFGASVEKVADNFELLTKFGAFTVSDALLTTESGSRGCLVFRHIAEGMPIQIHGWFCGAQGRAIDRTTLSCILDRVDLLSAGEDVALKAYFAEVERSRRPCGGYRSAARTAALKTTWPEPDTVMSELKTTMPDKSRRRPELRAN